MDSVDVLTIIVFRYIALYYKVAYCRQVFKALEWIRPVCSNLAFPSLSNTASLNRPPCIEPLFFSVPQENDSHSQAGSTTNMPKNASMQHSRSIFFWVLVQSEGGKKDTTLITREEQAQLESTRGSKFSTLINQISRWSPSLKLFDLLLNPQMII